MLDDKKSFLKNISFFKARKVHALETKYEKAKRRNFFISIILGFLIISLIYLLSNKSKISAISVEGNIYIKDEEIIELSGLSTKDIYLFTLPSSVQSKIKKNPLIDTCSVKMLDNQLIKISVTEKKIIGYTLDNGENVLVLFDDSKILLNRDNLYLIEKVPLIEGFMHDDLILVEKKMNELDYTLINEISEIHYYPSLKFQNLELVMRDGNYVFTSAYGLDLLTRYYDIVSSFNDGSKKCYYTEDISRNVYTTACPWEKPIQGEIKNNAEENSNNDSEASSDDTKEEDNNE